MLHTAVNRTIIEICRSILIATAATDVCAGISSDFELFTENSLEGTPERFLKRENFK